MVRVLTLTVILLVLGNLGRDISTTIATGGAIINTIAGNGISGFSGDEGPATIASMSSPRNVAVDTLGGVLICDTSNNRVRRVASNGIITTIAGSGICGGGPISDGTPATTANLCHPTAIAVDSVGNIFISDLIRVLIFRIDSATGAISKVAGTGIQSFNGDGIPAINAGFDPQDIAIDSKGNIFIADEINNRIRRIDAMTGIISTVAGNGSPGYNGDGIPATSAQLFRPRGVVLDGAGNILIAEQLNHRLRRIDAVTSVISSLAGQGFPSNGGDGGLAVNAFLNAPNDVSVDTDGNIFIADNNNHRVRRIDAVTGIINTVAGNGTSGFSGDSGPAVNAQLSGIRALAIDIAGNLFIADFFNYRIRRVDAPNQLPIAQCQNVTVTADASCTADASINNGSFDPDGDAVTVTQSPAGPYPLGTTNVTLTVTDSKGASSQCLATVTVVDGTAPTITGVSATPSVLWPPNHQMVDVTVSYAVADNCSASSAITCSLIVSSNEPVNGTGDGDTAPDWEIVDAHHVRLRAERAGNGNGRIYTITIHCTDGNGNSSNRTVQVTVPKSKK